MIGNLVRFRGDAPGMMTSIARRYGDVAFFRVGPAGFYLLSSPELARGVLEEHDERFERIAGERRVSGRLLHDALFASENPTHASERRLMEPVMYGQAPAAHAGAVVRHALRMTASWEEGREIDALVEAEHMTRAAMIEILFGLDPDGPEGRRLFDTLMAADTALNRVFLGATPAGGHLATPSRRRFRTALRALDGAVDDLARRRVAEGLGGEDVLTMVLRAGDRAMRPEQARDEVIGLFRGHMGAGAVLAWTWFLLSGHPDVREEVEREADGLGGDPQQLDDAHRLPVAMASFREAIRMYPTAWVLARRATAGHEVDGARIPPGATVLIPTWVIHHDDRNWDEPEVFRPRRYEDPMRTSDRQAPAYLPQGLGPKRCMGMEMLPVEIAFALATVARRWRLELRPGHRVEPLPKVTLKPKGGLPMVPRARPAATP
jgi:cytochrome P450